MHLSMYVESEMGETYTCICIDDDHNNNTDDCILHIDYSEHKEFIEFCAHFV